MRKLSILLIIIILGLLGASAQVDSTKHSQPSAEEKAISQYQELLNTDMNRMLELWYVKREVANSRSILSKLSDDTEITDDNMDSIYRQRLGKIHSVVQLGYNSTVKSYINLFQVKFTNT